MIRARLFVVVVLVMVVAGIAVAIARTLSPSVSVRDHPTEEGAPATVALTTSFDDSASGELHSFELDLTRGFTFDPNAAATCSVAQAHADDCGRASQIGTGTGEIHVQGQYLPPTNYKVNVALYLTSPPRSGDLAGVLLDVDEPQSQLSIVLLGDVVKLTGNSYGVALRFSSADRQLPAAYQLALTEMNITLGAQRRTSHGPTYNLLTNPHSCTRSGWPLLVTISSAREIKQYRATSPCIRRS